MNDPNTPHPTNAKSSGRARKKAPKGLWRHQLRPEWGVAVVAWEEKGRRAYQFDDGKLRVFKQGYYSLFDPVQDDGFTASALADELHETAGSRKKGPKLISPYPLETQIEIFRKQFPEGFRGHKFTKSYRVGPKRLKRHRDAAIAHAQEALAVERVVELSEAGEHSQIVDAIIDVLDKTDLVSSAALDRMAEMSDEAVEAVAEAFCKLVAGDKRYGTRFTRFVAAVNAGMGKRPSWRLATALPALLFPMEHVCVRKSVFLSQAASLAPKKRYTRHPRRKSYKNFQRMAMRLRDQLLDAGLHPRDLMDVHDFIWLTLRPAAAKLID